MGKKITDQQIEQILKVVWAEGIKTTTFEALQKLLAALPKIEEPKEDKKK